MMSIGMNSYVDTIRQCLIAMGKDYGVFMDPIQETINIVNKNSRIQITIQLLQSAKSKSDLYQIIKYAITQMAAREEKAEWEKVVSELPYSNQSFYSSPVWSQTYSYISSPYVYGKNVRDTKYSKVTVERIPDTPKRMIKLEGKDD